MNYRLLACDIDNTLLKFPAPPTPRVTATIRKAIDAGIAVVLVTGRAFRRARPVAQHLDLGTPIICNHGGSIRDTRTGAVIHRKVLLQPVVREIVAWLQTQRVHQMLFDRDCVYHDGTTGETVPDFQVYTCGNQSTYSQDLLQILPQETEIILTTSPDHEHLSQVYARAQVRFGDTLRVLFSHPFGMDVMPLSSKSEALAWLAAHYDIPQAQVAAIGDGDNDVDMLAWAGLGIAMGNGTPKALAASDAITLPFDQDGLAWAIDRYLLTI
jgi:Cof subfamily protein (haloacid dehalogenase superfamily)